MKLRILAWLFVSMVVQGSDIFLDIQYHDQRAIAKWFRSKSDIKVVNKNGQTVLIKAVQSGNKALVRRLLMSKADVNVVDDFGKTALDYAAEQGRKKIVLKLVKHKAMVTNQENMIIVRQIITSKYRFLKAIGTIFKGCMITAIFITTFALGIMLLGPTTKGLEVIIVVGGIGYVGALGLFSAPFLIASTYWKDRINWYNPLLITNRTVLV